MERIERGEAIEQEEEFETDEEVDSEEDEEEDNGLYGGARTKQTARKSYGGKAPRKAIASTSLNFGN